MPSRSDVTSANKSFTPPPGCPRIKLVDSFEELVSTPFGDGVNALCWPRELPGDFREIAELLGAEGGEEISTIDDARLRALSLSDAGKMARDILLQDQEMLRAHDLAPVLDCVRGHVRPVSDDPVATDVYSFHADSATVQADTYLCTYTGACSEGLRNEEAQRRVDVPETRAALLAMFGGDDNSDFLVFLSENYFDLHYVPLPGAQPFSFGTGNLWRLAIEYPGCAVPPCIHRAPLVAPGQPSRLLLLS
jgi:hypothetical protein